MTAAGLMAAAAAVAAVLLLSEALDAIGRGEGLAALSKLLAPARAAGVDGRDPVRVDRWRLALLAFLVAAAIGLSLAGLLVSLVLAASAPITAAAVINFRKRRWRRRLAADAAPAARSLADALSAGRSISRAISETALDAAVERPTRIALLELAAAVELGQSVDEAMESFGRRAGRGPWEAIVAAVRLQSRSGGDLSRLLRRLAAELDGAARARRDARAASSQARLTARIVFAMPALGALAVLVAAPESARIVLRSPIPRLLLLTAVILQVVALLAVRRVARVRP